ncbi:MAG: DUF2007 domain-containing protein [Bacteroidota bacterium]|nr:DUF2007 domain-containing protein [Chitinophagaceae bacterium]QLH44887.1 MAG: DUF2007 domain-containing protein [Bacteroidota bacterium]
MSQDKIKWVCVFKSNSRFEAEAVQGNLESSDIPCVLINKQDSSYLSFGYVEIHVPDSYQVIAENLLNDSIQQN